jgi:hypothetical protein
VAAVSSGMRAAAILWASGCGAPRRSTDGDAPMAGGQAPTALPNQTSGGGTLGLVVTVVARGVVGFDSSDDGS